MSMTLDERMENNAFFLLLNERAGKPANPNKPAITIAPETQSGSHDHSRIWEGITFNTDNYDPQLIEEALQKWGQRGIGQSEVTHIQAVSRFPDGTSKNITFASLGKFNVQDDARHETVAGKPAVEFLDQIKETSAKITPGMKTVTDYDSNYGQPLGRRNYKTTYEQRK